MTNIRGANYLFNRMRFVSFLLFATCTVLSSCGSPTKSVELAKQSVEKFHSQLDSGQFVDIYAASDEKFHQATGEANFVKLLDAVHRKLGVIQQSNLQNTGVAWYTGQGATVRLVYETKFAQGSGTETFVWHVKDDAVTLYGYNINSNDLITNTD